MDVYPELPAISETETVSKTCTDRDKLIPCPAGHTQTVNAEHPDIHDGAFLPFLVERGCLDIKSTGNVIYLRFALSLLDPCSSDLFEPFCLEDPGVSDHLVELVRTVDPPRRQ